MSYYFDTTPYVIQNAGKSYSFTKTGETYRFEVHSGDKGRTGDSTQERSEIASTQKLQFGHTYLMNYDFMVEPGSANTSKSVDIGQFHGTPDAKDYGSLGPDFAIKLAGEHMRIVTRADSNAVTASRPPDNFIYTDPNNIQRGHWYHLQVEIRFDPQGDGLVNVWRDGVQIAHYTGAVGYNDAVGPYWKMGVYRAPAPEALAVDYRDLTLVDEGSSTSSTTPTTPTTPTTTAQPLVLYASDHGDTLLGGAANDRLLGGAGADMLKGAGGADLLKGAGGDDTLVGGAGADTLVGGTGHNVFSFDKLDGSVDLIVDFKSGDKIDLTGLGVKSDAVFVNGMGATAAGQAALHYNASDGALYLDSTGGDTSDAVQIAILKNHATLSHDSFLLA